MIERNVWTPDLVISLTRYWEEGVPSSEIGRRLGITKNAAVGKAHRLGLKKRQSPVRTPPAIAANPRGSGVDVKSAQVSPVVTTPNSKGVDLFGLTEKNCHWPEGEPGTSEFYFCGEPAVPDKPYCGAHCARAYVKSSKGAKHKALQNA
ncbi:GcrA family cell cycle regulator [candidate division KSB1 bacterium]